MQKQLTLSLPTVVIGGLLVAAIIAIAVLVTLLVARRDDNPRSVVVPTAAVQTSPVPSTAVPSAVLPTTTAVAPTEAAVTTATYDDPFAYCSAVGTIDSPDNRYIGAQYPQSVLDAFAAARRRPLISSTVPWRCVLGQVWGCFVGANLPCGQIDTRSEPTERMNDFCRESPNATFIPAAITGHSTLYAWVCHGELAVARREVVALDARGFGAEYWYHLYPQ